MTATPVAPRWRRILSTLSRGRSVAFTDARGAQAFQVGEHNVMHLHPAQALEPHQIKEIGDRIAGDVEQMLDRREATVRAQLDDETKRRTELERELSWVRARLEAENSRAEALQFTLDLLQRQRRYVDERIKGIRAELVRIDDERRRSCAPGSDRVQLAQAADYLQYVQRQEALTIRSVGWALLVLAGALALSVLTGSRSYGWVLLLNVAGVTLAASVAIVGALVVRRWTFAVTVTVPTLLAVPLLTVGDHARLLTWGTEAALLIALGLDYAHLGRRPVTAAGRLGPGRTTSRLVVTFAVAAVVGMLYFQSVAPWYVWPSSTFVLAFTAMVVQATWEPSPAARRVAGLSAMTYLTTQNATLLDGVAQDHRRWVSLTVVVLALTASTILLITSLRRSSPTTP